MKWAVRKTIDKKIEGVEIPYVIEQLLLQRGFSDKKEVDQFLNPDYERDLHDPFLFRDMQKLVERVQSAIAKKEKIGIFGDHDADGVSAATILSEGLEKLGLEVFVYIPDKITEGHGLNQKAIDYFCDSKVGTVFTVDCGTSNIPEVELLNERGVDVIITDHHHAPEVLPDAYAIINPQVKGEKYPFKELSGTAVAFKVVQALYTTILGEGANQTKWFLDIVSVGTIADCMPLLGENRTLVKYGLLVLSKTRRPGYQELIAAGNIKITPGVSPSAYTVAFQIAPRINAAGRMTHAKHAYELMRTEDFETARKKAIDIENLNIERRKLVERITRDVEKIVKKDFSDKHFVAVASEDYPVGIVGIVAGRIAEKYKKPTGIFTKFEEESRGSFRSIEGVHILDVLDGAQEHLGRYGGHEKAAGATISNAKIEAFAHKANMHAKKIMDQLTDTSDVEEADYQVAIADVDHELLQYLKSFEPFGESNPEPRFYISDALIHSIRFVGNGEKHLKIVIKDDQESYVNCIAFNLGKKHPDLAVGDIVDIVGHIQENEWMGNISVQLNVIDIIVK